MFDPIFERSSEELLRVVRDSLVHCEEFKSRWVCTDHLLLVLIRDLPGNSNDVAVRALSSMNIDAEAAEREVRERFRLIQETEPEFVDAHKVASPSEKLAVKTASEFPSFSLFSQIVVDAFKRAEEYSLYLGQEEITAAHLLLAIIDLPDAGANKILDEISANLTFLRRQILQIMAADLAVSEISTDFKATVRDGIAYLVGKYQACVDTVHDLASRSQTPLMRLIGRPQLVHMVCVSYLGDFLATQVTFQRYLLEENLKTLSCRIGSLEKEMSASIVSAGAQNLRAAVRTTIEHLWCNEYRILNQMLNEAEHDLIGSVIEDLWWAQSEEIALHNLFAEAMDDHRRKHLLNLQKRRLEISQRLTKLQDRLNETIRQCFVKHPISA